MEVINGSYYCLFYKDVRLMPCIRPPPKQLLLEKLMLLMAKLNKNPGIDDKHTPDKQWIIAVLATLNSKDEIFDKNYVPPVKFTAEKIYKSIDLPSSFIKGLPISRKVVKCRRLKLITSGKSLTKVMKLNDAKRKIEKAIEAENLKVEIKKVKK